MIKRLFIVLAAALAATFVPFYVGRICEPKAPHLLYWPIGAATIFIASVIIIFVLNGIRLIVEYIKYGE